MIDWKALVQIVFIFLLSGVKFGLVGVPTAVFAQWSFFKVVCVTVAGGVAGVFFFTFLSDKSIAYYKKLSSKGANDKVKKGIRMTFTAKLIIRIKQRLGLVGLAILTPSLLSIPLGVFLAVRYYKDKRKIIQWMCLSILIWAILLFFFYNNLYHVFQYYYHLIIK